MWITKREREILRIIIEIYMEKGTPVSSRMVSKRKKDFFSPATIRNDMLSLEEKGYLYQPHSQSGRIPTTKAINYYLKHLIDESKIDVPELNFKSLSGEFTDLTNFWKAVSQNLSSFSENIGFILAPSFFSLTFTNVRFLSIGSGKIIIVLETPGGLVATRVVKVKEDIIQRDLDEFSTYINTYYRGKSLDYVLKDVYLNAKKEQKKLLFFISVLKTYIINRDSKFEFYFDGEERMLEKTIDEDVKRIKELVQLLENRDKLIKLLKEAKNQEDVNVVFSPLIGDETYEDFSLFVSDYQCGEEVEGKVGILGFRRLNYPIVYNLVKKTAESLSGILGENL